MYRRGILWILFALVIIPGMAFAVTEILDETNDVFVRLPDSYLDANHFSPPQEGRALVADLSGMTLTLYDQGVATATYPILSKGRKGTPWETPGGVYQVLSKEKTHFSSLGHVFMPWSMQFYGNFFIHGWPYDADGNDVPRGYSGGCIRLSTPDAEQVYAFAERGTSVIVRAKNDVALSGGYYVSTNEPPPTLSATSFVVMDLDRGQILWKKNPQMQFRDPLTGKFLSALASLEHMNQYTPRDLPRGSVFSSSWMDARTALPARDLIAPLLFTKDTTIEELLAGIHGKRLFLNAMRGKATAVGMTGTTVDDLGGPSTTNMTTVTDMVHLLRALDQSKRYVLEVTASPLISIPDQPGEAPTVLVNMLRVVGVQEGIRGGMVDHQSGNGLYVFDVETTDAGPRSLAVAFGGSTAPEEDMSLLMRYVGQGVRFIPGTQEGVVSSDDVGFFTKIRLIWNRKRIGDMLLGERAQDRTVVVREVFQSAL